MGHFFSTGVDICKNNPIFIHKFAIVGFYRITINLEDLTTAVSFYAVFSRFAVLGDGMFSYCVSVRVNRRIRGSIYRKQESTWPEQKKHINLRPKCSS